MRRWFARVLVFVVAAVLCTQPAAADEAAPPLHMRLNGDFAQAVWEVSTGSAHSDGVVTVTRDHASQRLQALVDSVTFDENGGVETFSTTIADVTTGFQFSVQRAGLRGASVTGQVTATRTTVTIDGPTTEETVVLPIDLTWVGAGPIQTDSGHWMSLIAGMRDNMHWNGRTRSATATGSFAGTDINDPAATLGREVTGDVSTDSAGLLAARSMLNGGPAALQPVVHNRFNGVYATADWVDYSVPLVAGITVDREHNAARLIADVTRYRTDDYAELIGDTTTHVDVSEGFDFALDRKTLDAAAVHAGPLPATRCTTDYASSQTTCRPTTMRISIIWTAFIDPMWRNLHETFKVDGFRDVYHSVGWEAEALGAGTMGGLALGDSFEGGSIGRGQVSEALSYP
ncbi:MAG TPA: hypothetical protein VFJ66_10180 [Gaiellales bacterium]|nr:hypothetical protein [Gaiellales bacterium]